MRRPSPITELSESTIAARLSLTRANWAARRVNIENPSSRGQSSVWSQRYIYLLAFAKNMDILWLPFSLATIMMYGLGQVFAKETRTNVSSANLLLLLGGNMFVMWSVYWLVFREPGSFDNSIWFQAVIGAALSGFAYVTYYESLKHGKVSIVGTIAGAYAPWTVIL